MIIWYKLLSSRHPNVVGFLGYITNVSGGFGLVSEYFSGGNVMHYLRNASSADRLSLVSAHFCRDDIFDAGT